jgi:hypothetical protein
MKFSKGSSFLAFGLLFGICWPGVKASADEIPAEGSTLEIETTDQHVSISILAAVSPEASADALLPDEPGAGQQQQVQAGSGAGSGPPSGTSTTAPADSLNQGRQTRRILFLMPNFTAVSANEQLPPQSVKEKFKTATLDSVDYSAFVFVAGQAGVAQASRSYPEFGQGARGYGRYYWHLLADSINENYWVEFLVPTPLHEDTRYYTLGKGDVAKRLGYAFTRILITRSDEGHETFNAGEILGAGAFAGLANLYYPSPERTFTKTYQRWITNVTIDGCVFVFKEFWPDINNTVFHQKD